MSAPIFVAHKEMGATQSSERPASSASFAVDGLSVGHVRYTAGAFRQTARPEVWVQDVHEAHPRRNTFRYAQKSRSERAVVLHDDSRDVTVLLDLSTAVVRAGQGSDALREIAKISDASIAADESMFEINGLSLGLVKYPNGVFRRTASGQSWVEDASDREPKRNTFIFRETERAFDTVLIRDDGRSISLKFDLSTNRILYGKGDGTFEDLYAITEVAITEPLGVILTKIVVVEEDDPGLSEEVYGRLYTKAIGAHVAPDSSRERDLWNSTTPLDIAEGQAHQFEGHKVLFYGLDPDDQVWVGGRLKEKDLLRDDDLGTQRALLRVRDIAQGRDVSLRFVHDDTKVDVHFHVTRNYNEFVTNEDGFLARRAHGGVQYVPRFSGIAPFASLKTTSFSNGVNVLPDAPKPVNNGLRTVLLFGLGYVPQVGGVLSEVVGFLWPEEEIDVWDEIKGRAEAMMKNLIEEQAVQSLENRLAGLKETIENYENTSLHSPEKGTWLVNIMAALNEAQPFFFNERHPEHMLPYLVTLGTLTLVVMREQTMFYEDIYGVKDPDADYKLKQMRERFNEYQDAVSRAVQPAIDWRMDLIRLDDGKVSDTYTGTSFDRPKDAEVLYLNLRRAAKNKFTRMIEEVTEPAAMWKYVLLENKGTKITRVLARAQSGPFPIERWSTFEENGDGQAITSIVVSSGDLVDGLQLWYNGKPGPVHGQFPTGRQQERFDLVADEAVIAVSGRSGDLLDSIWFFTSKGRVFGGGRLDGGKFEWTASAPSADGYLESLFGTRGAFGFNWRYYKVS